jgi:hypothetical protein
MRIHPIVIKQFYGYSMHNQRTWISVNLVIKELQLWTEETFIPYRNINWWIVIITRFFFSFSKQENLIIGDQCICFVQRR